MLKRIDVLIIAILFTVAVFVDGYSIQTTAETNTADVQASTGTIPDQGHHNCHEHGGSMSMLAKITGKSIDELESLYPQKTAWQIAKSMGRLDELKSAYLSAHKTFIDKLVDEKKITADEGDAIFSDIQKRVALIDGVNIVIPGHSSFKKPMVKE